MPRGDLVRGSADGRKPAVRTAPAQRRSAERLDALLDAAATVVDELGAERLTTQLVAERADASIGTVYRYFPDRVAVLRGLRDRSVHRYRERVARALQQAELRNWWEVFDVAITVSVECYRTEPGFRMLRTTEREREAGEGGLAGPSVLADRLATVIETEFGPLPGVDSRELRFRVDAAVEIGDALIARAVAGGRTDERYLAACRSIVHDSLAGLLGAARRADAA